MGMFDFLFNKEKAQANQIDKLRKKLTNIWVQSPDRNYAAEQLRDIGTEEALRALLERFKINVKNSTYDNEEKLYVYDMLVAKGPAVIELIKDYIRKDEASANWPMRVLDDLLTSEQMATFITELLEAQTIDYQRDPEKKEQLILRAGNYPDYEALARQVARFTVDDNENIRFLATSQTLERDADWALEALRENIKLEDSGRILNQVCDRFIALDTQAVLDLEDEGLVSRIKARLPSIYFLTEDGHLRRK